MALTYRGWFGENCLLKLSSIILIWILKKGKQNRNRPGVAQRVPGGLGSQIFMTFGI